MLSVTEVGNAHARWFGTTRVRSFPRGRRAGHGADSDFRRVGRRQRRPAGGAAGRHRHHQERRHRAHPHGRHRRRRPLRVFRAAARRALRDRGRARRLLDPAAQRPDLQRRPARRDQRADEAVEHPGDDHRVRRGAARPGHVVGSVVDHRPPRLRDPAGGPAQLHAPAVARLQRRAEPAGHQRGQRRRRRSVELRHLRGRHQQPLQVADAAAGAPAGIGRLRPRDRQGSAAHHQRLLGGVRRTLGRRRQHDHQERHQRGGRLAVHHAASRRARRPSPAGPGGRALQPAAGRRRDRRPAAPGQDVLLRQLRVPPRAQRSRHHLAGRHRAVGEDAGRRASGARARRLPLRRPQQSGPALQHGALAEGQRSRRLEPARHRLHLGQQRRHRARHVHHREVVALPERSAGAVPRATPTAAPPS